MKIKLLKPIQLNGDEITAEHILEIEDEAGQKLIDEGSAVLYTAEMEQTDESQIIQEEVESLKEEEKKIKPLTKSITDYSKGTKEIKKMDSLLGKAVKTAIDTKAVTSFASTEATPVLGQIFSGSKILAKTNQMPINGNLNIVYTAALSGSGIGPTIEIIGEATANAESVPLVQYAAIPAKWFATVAIPNEYLDDVAGMETFVANTLKKEAGRVLDNSILNGSFTNNYGFRGIVGDANAVKTTIGALSAVTKTEIETMMANVLPEAQDNAMWVVSPAFWSLAQGALLDADNVGGQLIKDGAQKSLYGYPVVVTTAAPSANPAFFGDFGEYVVGIAKNLTIEVDRSCSFLTDSTAVKVGIRAAGGLASSVRYYNGTTYGVVTYAGV